MFVSALHCCQHCTVEEHRFKWPTCGLTGHMVESWSNLMRAHACMRGCVLMCVCAHAHVRVSMLTLWPLHWLSLATNVRLWTSVRAGRIFITPQCVCVSAACHLMDIKLPIWEMTEWLQRGNTTRPSLWGSLSGYLLCHGSLLSLSTQKYPTGEDTEFCGCPNLEGSFWLFLWLQIEPNWLVTDSDG